MTKAIIPSEKYPKSNVTTQKTQKKIFDYTTIADRLRTVSWSNDSHPTGVVKSVYGIPTFPLTTKAVQSKRQKDYYQKWETINIVALFSVEIKSSKIEKVPRGIRGEKSSKDMASSRNLVSTIGALASPKMGDGTRCPEG